jgi:hypothetical protein
VCLYGLDAPALTREPLGPFGFHPIRSSA